MSTESEAIADAASPKAEPWHSYQLIGASEDGAVRDLLSELDDRSARQRLQAVLSEWLRMDNVVVLAGSGTSVSSGGKTLLELEKGVLDAVRLVPALPPALAALVEERRQQPKNSLSFEDWLTYLVNAQYLASSSSSPFNGVQWKQSTPPTSAELSFVIRLLTAAIFAECSLRLSDDTVDALAAPHVPFVAKLIARESSLGRAHLFTLNYDTLFEQTLDELGVQYFDGFSGRAEARFDPSVYGLDVYYPGEVAEGRVRRFDRFLHLYKLHGSIHWFFDGAALKAKHPALPDAATYRSKNAAEKAAILVDRAGQSANVAILPTANKFVQTLSMPFAQMFRSFQARLALAQTFLLVTGYGFGDEHVNRAIETSLANPSLVMLVVEPDPRSGTIERIKRYKEMGRRAFVLTSTPAAFEREPFAIAAFADFSRHVLPDVQWLEDFRRLRQFEKQIAAGFQGMSDRVAGDGHGKS